MSHIFIPWTPQGRDLSNQVVDALAKNKSYIWANWKSPLNGKYRQQEIYHGIKDVALFLWLSKPFSATFSLCNPEIAFVVKIDTG